MTEKSLSVNDLLYMKAMSAQRGEWREVKRINKMLEFRGYNTKKKIAVA